METVEINFQFKCIVLDRLKGIERRYILESKNSVTIRILILADEVDSCADPPYILFKRMSRLKCGFL